MAVLGAVLVLLDAGKSGQGALTSGYGESVFIEFLENCNIVKYRNLLIINTN